MRKVNEILLSAIPKATKRRKLQKRVFHVVCDCGYETNLSQAGFAYYPNGYKCRKCKAKDQQTLNQALINLAKNKGLMK